MVSKELILEALKSLQDPEYGKSVVELNFVRDMMIKENNVSLTFVVTTESEDYQNEVRQAVTQALEAKGVGQVHIRFRSITDFEREQLAQGGIKAAVKNEIPNLLALDSQTKFIAIASGKGGVGKSTVTVNLAVALARLGNKVGIIDADIYGFSIPDMMGIEERPELVDNAIIPVVKHGVKVVSMGFFVPDNAPVVWRGPMLGKMLRNFFAEVNWGEIDYMLLDLPPGTGDIALDVHQMIPQSTEIIVTTPHATAAFVAARAGSMARSTNHEILGVVENMSYYECGKCGEKEFVFGRGGGAKLAEELHTELLAQVPLGAPDNHISEADYAPSVYKADHPTGQLYLEVARQVTAKLN
ncbi:Mrp/NBP35 family ATP-binding protein [Paenibacillus sp. N1-5-1-14]|uniref:Mrp/NBP35 family ATP-binding protein n=1 Tax=Paenibacillus radicibacter TaxID=2972488 RepID=UPI002158A7C1|nr:Mrp/NBP35 family ATP-binding protein [Paenibacillus radicibacter]MCR8645759.1 Mrp/NBP35 family ATP-binding protein [Paenibacillus radicibacter]